MQVIDLTELYGDVPYPSRPVDIITDFIVHHSDTDEPTDLENAKALIAAIHEYHASKWPGIAYHRAVWNEYYFLLRPRSRNGWHTGGMDVDPRNGIGDGNDHGIACCVLGNYTDVAPSEQSLLTLAEGKEWEEQQLGRPLDLSGHQDWTTTTCPGKGWPEWRNAITTQPVQPPAQQPPNNEDFITAIAYIADSIVVDRLTAEIQRVTSNGGCIDTGVVQSVIDETASVREQFIGPRP